MPIGALVFDFDGVILQSVEAKTRAFGMLVAGHGDEARRRMIEYHLAHGGVSRYEKFAWFHREVLGEEIDEERSREWGAQFTELCYRQVLGAPFVAGAREVLERWQDRLPLFVASGTPQEELAQIVRDRGLGRFFQGVHGTPPAKHRLLAGIVKGLGLEAGRVLMVGDSSTDREAAETVGTGFFGVGDSFASGPWPWGKDLHALADYLEREA